MSSNYERTHWQNYDCWLNYDAEMNASDAGKINNIQEKNFEDQANNNDKQITMLHKEDSQRTSLNRKYLG